MELLHLDQIRLLLKLKFSIIENMFNVVIELSSRIKEILKDAYCLYYFM